MPRKPPRRTRERILETALRLFNDAGEPNVTTADIADELNISPGNLYYHFSNKGEIIVLLFDALDASLAPLFSGPSASAAEVEDLWLFLHLVFERIWEYRFFFRDLDEIASRDPKLATRVAGMLRSEESAVLALCGGLRAAGALRATDEELVALAVNVVVIATYWMSFRRLSNAGTRRAVEDASDMQFERAISQVLAMLAPHLHGDHRALAESLRARYLRDTRS
ncbi:MAG: TetR/AcrR family transcriptional regulator [Betaproteobacteria bacterium]